jgi:hypothetical protein
MSVNKQLWGMTVNENRCLYHTQDGRFKFDVVLTVHR